MYKATSLVPSTSKNKNNPYFPDPVGLPSHFWSSDQNVKGCIWGADRIADSGMSIISSPSEVTLSGVNTDTYHFKNFYFYEQFLTLDLV